jgi:hypothetical protein
MTVKLISSGRRTVQNRPLFPAPPFRDGTDMTDRFQAPGATEDTHSPPVAAIGNPAGGFQRHELVLELEGLEHRLATQPIIEQSKGILMCHFGIGPDTAFDVLRRWSSHTNLKVRDISRMLVAAAAAESPADPGRANRELINLINRLAKGQIPTSSE